MEIYHIYKIIYSGKDMKNCTIDVLAKAYLMGRQNVLHHPDLCMDFLSGDEKTPSKFQVRQIGGISAITKRITAGNLNIDEHLGVWNSGFISGLKNSGCLAQCTAFSYTILSSRNQDLINDLSESSLCSVYNSSYDGQKFVGRFPLLHYPSEQGFTKEYIAGLLAGGMIVEKDGLQWIALVTRGTGKHFKALVNDAERKRALNEWGILFNEDEFSYCSTIQMRLLISPFYGVIFSQYMPVHSFSRMMRFSKPAMCPELSILYWNICVKETGDRSFPLYVDEMPFVGSYMKNRKSPLRDVDMRRKGIDMGIVRVSSGLRGVMKDWAKWHKNNRLAGKLAGKSDESTELPDEKSDE
jgi:hypothetical protein